MILERAKVKVLVVLIGDWSETRSQHYLDLLNTLSAVTISQGSIKDDPFHAQFREGRIYYDFATSYYHDELREMELHRILFGIIGMVDCSSGTDMSKLLREFNSNLIQYQQSSLFRSPITKLVGFNSDMDNPDLTMIPTLDPISKLTVAIEDFTFDLITEFGVLLARLEKVDLIPGPVLISSQFLDDEFQGTPQFQQATKRRNSGVGLISMDKAKKRTTGRALKLLGEMYLLAGRLDLALKYLGQAIDDSKAMKDYQWHASALDSNYCTTLMMLLNQTTNNNSQLCQDIEIFFLADKYRPLHDFVTELPDKYRDILGIYEKAYAYGVIGFYPLQQTQLCSRIAKFLHAALAASFTGLFTNTCTVTIDNELNLDLQGAKTKDFPAKLMSQMSQINTASPKTTAKIFNLPEKDKGVVSKLDILVWIHRAASVGLEYLSVVDQIMAISELTSICGLIDCRRKQSYYLMLLTNILIKTSTNAESIFGPLKVNNNAARSALGLMKKQSILLESASSQYRLIEDLENTKTWVEHYGIDPLLSLPNSKLAKWSRFGWTELQLATLDKAVKFADEILDFYGIITSTISLISRMYYLLDDEKLSYYSQLLYKGITYHRKQFNYNVSDTTIQNFGISLPVLRRIDILGPSGKHLIKEHKTKVKLEQAKFLYSPFEKVDEQFGADLIVSEY